MKVWNGLITPDESVKWRNHTRWEWIEEKLQQDQSGLAAESFNVNDPLTFLSPSISPQFYDLPTSLELLSSPCITWWMGVKGGMGKFVNWPALWRKTGKNVLNCLTFKKHAQQNYQNYHCQKEQYWQTPVPEKFKPVRDPVFEHCSADSVFLKLRKLNSVALLWILFSWFPIFPWQVFWFGSWVLPLAGMRKWSGK